MDNSKQTAEDHWKFLESWLHMVYVDSFIHGYKHGVESVKEANRESDIHCG
jgi:hypothetical protein